jgi:hypothetical protein
LVTRSAAVTEHHQIATAVGGSIEIVVGYTGDEHRLPGSLIVPHLVQ